VLRINDQQENFEEIIKSCEIDPILSIKSDLHDAVKLKTQEVSLQKESLRTEEIKAHNENLKLQSEYSTQKIEHDTAESKNEQFSNEYEKIQTELEDRVKPNGREMNIKQELSDAINNKESIIISCKLKKEKTDSQLKRICAQARSTSQALKLSNDKSAQLKILEDNFKIKSVADVIDM